MPAVGRSATRREGPEKLCGLARYVDDYVLPGCLHGVTLRSTIPHGIIRRIVFDPAYPWDEFLIATAADVPGTNGVLLLEADQPLLADRRVMHAEEPIVLIAHAERDRAYDALRHVTVEYEPLDPVLTIDESLALTQKLYRDTNVFKEINIALGDVEAGLRAADLIVEGEYHVPHQEHAYIENNGVAAYIEPDGTPEGAIVVMGSMQCPFYVQKALKHLFGVTDAGVRVVQTTTGGGFGGKEEYPNMIAGHAALLTRKCGRPVKIIYDRHEDMAATTKRHPARVRHRTGVMRDGRIVAQDIDIVIDGGAYVTLSPVVLSRGILHATGPYGCPNVRLRGRAVATNTPPNGAFRGFGAPQTLFAAELQMEKVASALGMDALTLRRLNMVRRGTVLATGQTLLHSIGARDVLDVCVKRSDYRRKLREHARWNRDPNPTWRGIGLALVHHGAGFTGRGEVMLASRAAVTLGRDGAIAALAASTEMGQGAITTFSQIVSDALGVSIDWVTVDMPDTWRVPNSGPTVASRTVMIVGGLLERAAARLRRRITGVTADGRMPSTREDLAAAARRLCGDAPELRIEEEYQKPPEITWNEELYRGDAYPVYSYAAAAIDLEIDRATCEVTVRRVTTAQDIGKAINPLLVEGQIIGGTAQGLGYALLEQPVYKNGAMQNAQLTNYIIPTSLDMPPMDVVLVEKAYKRGPSGAKGIGELPMDVPGPAVAAAVFRATGLFIADLPILPEKILAASLAREAQVAAAAASAAAAAGVANAAGKEPSARSARGARGKRSRRMRERA